ncbi:TPA: LPXTG cell wall anchor domain-containing protein [Streptococcus suis]
MHAKKLVKWGVALTSTLVLGGVIAPVDGNLVNTTSVVYAEEMQSRVAVHAGYYFDGELAFAAFDLEEFWIGPGENKTIAVPVVDGYVYEGKYLLSNGNGERLLQGSPSARYEDTVGSSFVDVILIYAPAEKPVEQPVETPTDQPTEKPVKQPVSTPTEQPVEKPVEKPVETPAGQPTETPAEKPVETPTEKTAEQPAETPTDQPTDQPVETPAGQPTEQPVEQPANQPTEKPTATSLLAGNTTSKAQTGATTDKKKVDNSTPSTNAVKPEEGSQTTAKTLPKTGDSSSMLLVLGGLLSGLSGLGLAATSRKRD